MGSLEPLDYFSDNVVVVALSFVFLRVKKSGK